MRFFTEPNVKLVGQTTLNQQAIEEFGKERGFDMSTDAVWDQDYLPEIAGRLCFDDKTEILTDLGWLNFKDLKENNKVYTLNPLTHELILSDIIKKHEYNYEGRLYNFENQYISYMVTPEHNQYVDIDKSGKYQLIKTEKLIYSQSKYLLTCDSYKGVIPDNIILPKIETSQINSNQHGTYNSRKIILQGIKIKNVIAFAKLLTHYIANGSLSSENSKSAKHIVIYGRESEEIITLCNELGFKTAVYIDPRNQCKRTTIYGKKNLYEYIQNNCGRGCFNKKFPNWVTNLPIEDLQSIWWIMVKTDGHFRDEMEKVFSSSIKIKDQLQEILTKIGFASSTILHGNCWSINKKIRKIAVSKKLEIKSSPYIGNVYCVSTENGIVCIRRNGKVHYSGNCYLAFDKRRPAAEGKTQNETYLDHIKDVKHGSVLEHATFNYILSDISRNMTHELVRHRTGISFSQTSTRYVDQFNPKYHDLSINQNPLTLGAYITQEIKDDPELFDGYIDQWNQIRQKYEQSFARFRSQGMEVKEARTKSRGLLPGDAGTMILVSVNIRELDHIFTMRGSLGADIQIRRVAIEMWKRVKHLNVFKHWSYNSKLNCLDKS